MVLNMQQLRESFFATETDSLRVMDVEVSKIYGGEAYVVSQCSALNGFDIAAPLTYHVTTPDSLVQAHMLPIVSVGAGAILEIFEDDGVAAHFDVSNGVAVIPVNKNRNSSNLSTFVVASGVTVTQATADVLIYNKRIGGIYAGGEAIPRGGFVLKYNTEYLFRATSDVDNSEGSLILSWHELLTGA